MNKLHVSGLALVVATLGGVVAACSSNGGDSNNQAEAGVAVGPPTGAPVGTVTPDGGPPSSGACPSPITQVGVAGTTSGAQAGVKTGTTWAWKGIPYAAPPVGALRWQPPAAPSCAPGARDASAFGPMCPQLDSNSNVVGSEDCLTLNVWAPDGVKDAPVLVFIHGGANSQGSTSDALYDGAALATKTRAVVVTVEYRLGALGFFSHPELDQKSPDKVSGNYGILDQQAALRWVKTNAAAFGGAPSKVMLFGESAGAMDVMVQIASPLAKGLFDAATVESGGAYTTTLAQGEAAMATLIDAVGCTSAPDVLACMQGQTAAALAKVPSAGGPLDKSTFRYNPVIDGHVLLGTPPQIIGAGTHNHVPMILGTNAQETAKMVPSVATQAEYEAAVVALYGQAIADVLVPRFTMEAYGTYHGALVALTTDTVWTCPTRRLARAAVLNQAQPVFRYHFSWTVDSAAGKLVGSEHGIELPFVFDSLGGVNGYTPTAGDLTLVSAVEGYWAGLGAGGTPNAGAAPGVVTWPTYDAPSDPYLELNLTIASQAGLETANCDVIDSLSH